MRHEFQFRTSLLSIASGPHSLVVEVAQEPTQGIGFSLLFGHVASWSG